MRLACASLVGFASLVSTFALGCSGGGSSSGFGPEGSSSGSSGSSGASSSGFGGSSSGSSGSSGAGAGCADSAKLVYVVSEENGLYAFDPAALKFTSKGTLSCPAGGATPNSMAVDRHGTAWVNYSDGSLFEVSTADASCKATSYAKGQGGFTRVGMAFSSDSAGSEAETLYVVGIDGVGSGQGLGKIDLKTMKLTKIGDFSGSLRGQGAELTGTGDGKLYGFFTTSPASLAEIDKTTGATKTPKTLTGVSTGLAWAFSFWGGDFWFYTSGGIEPSRVTRMKAATDQSIGVAVANVGGFRIVGAGVSTCAPTTPPK